MSRLGRARPQRQILTEAAVLPAAGAITVVLGQAVETDVSLAMSVAKQKAIGLTLETDLAQTITPSKAKEIGLTNETDLAQPITFSKARELGLNVETDTALPITVERIKLLGLTSETDLAQTLAGILKTITFGIASEVDQALPMTVVGAATPVIGDMHFLKATVRKQVYPVTRGCMG